MTLSFETLSLTHFPLIRPQTHEPQVKKVPLIPKIKFKGDSRNFDSYPELDDSCFENSDKENVFASEFIDF